MKKLFRDQRFRFFGLVIGLLIISIGSINPVQAAQEGPPIDAQEAQNLEERQTDGEGTIPSGTSPAAPFALETPADPEQNKDQYLDAAHEVMRAEWEAESRSSGGVGSSAQFASILPLATNDDISSATVIGGLPYTDSVDTTAATLEAGEPAYTCGYDNGHSVWYSFSPGADGYYVVDTAATNYYAGIHVFNAAGMAQVGCDTISYDGWQSELPFYGELGETYLISITGSYQQSGSLTINMRATSAFTNCGAVDVPQVECAALRNFYNTTGGNAWTNKHGWKQTAEVCTWYGVLCDAGQVSGLTLWDNNIIGTIATDFSSLTNLNWIDLSFNSLSGDIGAVPALLPNSLLTLYLYDNDFTGTITPDFLSLTSLQGLDLGVNQISGDLGTALGNLPSGLFTIWLGTNNFTGTIPASLLSFTGLYSLGLDSNQLGGDIADAIGNLPNSIEVVFLDHNNYFGAVPASTASLTNLATLGLSGNLFTGQLADIIDNLPTTLNNLYLGSNAFTGTIPASIADITSLKSFAVDYNDDLTGTIPLAIIGLPLTFFNYQFTFLCEPGDAGYSIWKAGVGTYYEGYCGNEAAELSVSGITFLPTNPAPSEAFTVTVHARNAGGEPSNSNTWLDLYIDREPINSADLGDFFQNLGSLIPGERADGVFSFPGGMGEGVFDIHAFIDLADDTSESNEGNNGFTAVLNVSTSIFTDGFESGDLSAWSRFNDGGGYLTACNAAAINGSWGACVDRGTDKRKQLIDETPVNQTVFNAQFNIDPNSLSMGTGERFRFMQVKMAADRPFFVVLKYQGGEYLIQLNALLDDLTKVKTAWYPLTDTPHNLEVGWSAAAGVGTNDGEAILYLDGIGLETLTGLDNDTIFVESFKVGFTSKLGGKIISGIFYLDDIFTSSGGYIGLP